MAGTKTQTEGLPGFVTQSILVATTNVQNSLEGIDVDSLQDRATCYVRENAGLYRFFDTSTTAPSPPTIVRPAGVSGVNPGRWFLEEGGAVANSRTAAHAWFRSQTGQALTGPFGLDNYDTMAPAAFTAGPNNSADVALTAAAGRLTYNGAVQKLLTVYGAISVSLGANELGELAIFLNGAQVTTSQQLLSIVAANGVHQIVTMAVLALSPGDIVDLRFAEHTTGGTAVSLHSAYIAITD
jgi:hypothetical protein